MRTVSLTLRAAGNAEQTGEIPVYLLTVTHASLATPLRLSSDPTERQSVDPLLYGTTSRGEFYAFLPMSLTLPDDSPDTPPAIRVTIDNVARTLIPLLRSISTPAQVTVEMVLASAPDDVEATWPEFDLFNVGYDDAISVTADLGIPSFATEPYPAGTYSPAYFRGLYP